MRNLLDGLEEAGLKFSPVVATNVYDLNDFAKINRVYARYFPNIKPSRATVAQIPPRRIPTP
jgi:enamine deaminase RidA (YjgF/YER057c/UK114 family)